MCQQGRILNGQNSSGMRRDNRGLVLRLLHLHGALSRRDLGRLTGLMPSTITYITGELLEVGLIRDLGPSPTPRPNGGPGRRILLLEIVPDSAHVIGVHIGIRGIHVGLMNLAGAIRARARVETERASSASQISERIVAAARRLVAEANEDGRRILGVGLGMVGWVDASEGMIVEAPHRGWRDVPLGAWLAQALQLPVCLDNNVRAMASAEQWFGHGKGGQDFILVTVGTVLGAGIVVGGELIRGHAARAGQIGHMRVVEDGPLCACGRRGCLDAVASDNAIERRALEMVDADPASSLAAYVRAAPSHLADRGVFAAAAAGDAQARQIVADAASHLGHALAPLVAALDPERVVVVGAITELGDLFFGPLKRAMIAILGESGLHEVAIVPTLIAPTNSAETMPIVGAASLALRHYFADPDFELLRAR